jgi:hypothetical protein
VIRDAIERERLSRGIDVAGFSDDALAAVMSVVLKGLYWENLQEFHEGHDELMAAADRMLSALDDSPTPPRRRVAT